MNLAKVKLLLFSRNAAESSKGETSDKFSDCFKLAFNSFYTGKLLVNLVKVKPLLFSRVAADCESEKIIQFVFPLRSNP